MVLSSDRFSESNLDNYDDLIVSIEANYRQLNLLIAVCDNLEFRDRLIEQYEKELSSELPKYRIKLSPQQPSLSLQINQLVRQHPELKTADNAVITVTGTEQFRFLFRRAENQQSPQEELLGYFQWTREAFKDFPYSIIIWVTTYLQQQLEQYSPDFWSWRKGVFRFQCHAGNVVNVSDIQPHIASFAPKINRENLSLLPLEDLQDLIAKIEQDSNQNTAQLANLYRDLGLVYQQRCKQGKAAEYQQEQNLAIEYLQKAIKLQREFNLELDLATTLNNLARLYKSQGRYEEAEPLYIQALEMRRKLLGEEHPYVAITLNNLARLYKSQGRYEEAEPLYLQALEMKRKLLGEEHPDIATTLNNLAKLYKSQGRYEEAEPLYIQALEMRRKLLGEEHPDIAITLNNLARLYKSQGRYEEAEPLYIQALEIRRKLLGEEHPNTNIIYDNFIHLLQQAISENRVGELSQHPTTRSLLEKLQAS